MYTMLVLKENKGTFALSQQCQALIWWARAGFKSVLAAFLVSLCSADCNMHSNSGTPAGCVHEGLKQWLGTKEDPSLGCQTEGKSIKDRDPDTQEKRRKTDIRHESWMIQIKERVGRNKSRAGPYSMPRRPRCSSSHSSLSELEFRADSGLGNAVKAGVTWWLWRVRIWGWSSRRLYTTHMA